MSGELERIYQKYKKELDHHADFEYKAMMEILRKQTAQEEKYRDLLEMCAKVSEKNEGLHIALETALNDLAARDLLAIQETEVKRRNLSENLRAVRENEEYRARKPDFKAHATQPTDDSFLGYGPNVTAKQLKEMKEEEAAKG